MAEESLKEPTQIPSEVNAGEALEEIGFGIIDRSRHMEGDLGISLFRGLGELGAEESPDARSQLFIEQQSGLKIEISGEEERASGSQDEIVRTECQIFNEGSSLVDTEEGFCFGQTQELKFLDLEDLTDLPEKIGGLEDGIGAEYVSLSLHGLP